MRKTFILTIGLACFAYVSNAQISKGSTFLGGSFGVGTSSSKSQNVTTQESKSNSWSISPQIGTAVGTNKIVGLFLNYGHSNSQSGSGAQLQEQPGSTYGGGIFYRRYYPLSTRFYLFGDAGLGLNIGKEEQKYGGSLRTKTDRTGVSFGLTPGISYAAARKLHLEASLNSLASIYCQSSKSKAYPQTTGGTTYTSAQKQFGLSGNGNGFSAITIGLRWILPSKS